MAETLILNFNPQSLQHLKEQQTTFNEFLTAVFNYNEGTNYLQMCDALKSYHHQNGGAPAVIAFEVNNVKYNAAQLSGSINCRFKVSFFFGCDDLHIDKNDNITWDFKINEHTNQIQFTGEEPWEVL